MQVLCSTERLLQNAIGNFDIALPIGSSEWHPFYILLGVAVARLKKKQSQKQKTTRRSVEHCTPHADGAWLNELGWSQ